MVEFPDFSSYIFSRAIPGSQLCTTGWLRLFYVDEHTGTICLKELEFAQLSRKKTYDRFETEISDDVSELGFCQTPAFHFYFDFPEVMRSGFRQAVDVCSGLSGASLGQLDSTMRASTGVSLLASPIMRDILLYMAQRSNSLPSRKTPRHAQTTAVIALSGPPSDDSLTKCLRSYIIDERYREKHPHPRAEAALLRGGWRQPDGQPRPKFTLLASLYELREDDFLQDAHLEEDVRDAMHLMIERDYMGGDIDVLLLRLAGQGCVTVLRLALGDDGAFPLKKVSAELRAKMLLYAVAGEGGGRSPDRQPMLTYLLEGLEIDPNGQARHWAGGDSRQRQGKQRHIRQTALHVALEQKDTKTARFLLEKGASTDARDELGQTPLERGLL